MAETKKNSSTQSDSRLLDYEPGKYDEKIPNFKKRVEEQIASLELGMKKDIVNDRKVSENYIKKIRRFFQTEFFTDPKYVDKRVQFMKNELKVQVRMCEAISSIQGERIVSKRSSKILMAQRYSLASGGYGDFYYPYEYQDFYKKDLEYLYGLLPKYESQLLLVNRLKGILANKEFLKALGFKNSWKVPTLKKKLSNWVQDYSFEAEYQLEEIFTLELFTKKKYSDKTMTEFKDVVDVFAKALTAIIDWIKEQVKEDLACVDESGKNTEKLASRNIYDMYKVYDEFISKCGQVKKLMDERYSLYRFGQGLIEADIFDSLYQ